MCFGVLRGVLRAVLRAEFERPRSALTIASSESPRADGLLLLVVDVRSRENALSGSDPGMLADLISLAAARMHFEDDTALSRRDMGGDVRSRRGGLELRCDVCERQVSLASASSSLLRKSSPPAIGEGSASGFARGRSASVPTADEGAACFDGTCCCSEGVETLGAIGTAFEGFGGIGSEDTVDPPSFPPGLFHVCRDSTYVSSTVQVVQKVNWHASAVRVSDMLHSPPVEGDEHRIVQIVMSVSILCAA